MQLILYGHKTAAAAAAAAAVVVVAFPCKTGKQFSN